jgi:hypothetical protein
MFKKQMYNLNKKIMKTWIKKFTILALITGTFISCSDDTTTTQGDVKVSITDAPFPFNFATEANVNVAKVELKDANGNYTTVFEGNGAYNMVGLTNGVTAQVNATSIEAGTYGEARVTLSGASAHLSDGTVYDLTADASGSYTITIEPALVVEQGGQSEILLDLDISNSFQFEGMGGMQLPVWISSLAAIHGCSFDADFRAVDLDQTGTISGTVDNGVTAEHVANALVTVTVAGDEICTQTDANGNFTFIGVSEGTYTVHATTSDGLNGVSGTLTVTADGTATCSFLVN